MSKHSTFTDTAIDAMNTSNVLDQNQGSGILPILRASVEPHIKEFNESHAAALHAKEDEKIAKSQANAAKGKVKKTLETVLPAMQEHIPGFKLEQSLSKIKKQAEMLSVANTFLQYLSRYPDKDWAIAIIALIKQALAPLEEGIKNVSRTGTARQAAQARRKKAQTELNKRLTKVRRTVEAEKGAHSEEYQALRTQSSKRRKRKKAQASQADEAPKDAQAAVESKDAKVPEVKDAKTAAESKDTKEAPVTTTASNSDKPPEASANDKPSGGATTPSAKPDETPPAVAAPQTEDKAA